MSELNLPSVRRRYYPVKTKLSAVRDRVINEMGYAEVLSSTRSNPRLFTFGSTSINLEFYRKNNTNAYLRVITKCYTR